jgi:hypothetical protein
MPSAALLVFAGADDPREALAAALTDGDAHLLLVTPSRSDAADGAACGARR